MDTRDAFENALESGRALVTTSYVAVEATALIQHRIGMAATRDLHRRLMPAVEVAWITEALHRRAVARLLAEDRRGLSLVDCVSFEIMKERGLRLALTLDRHFEEAGFEILPGSASE